jgi:hypothetical protein
MEHMKMPHRVDVSSGGKRFGRVMFGKPPEVHVPSKDTLPSPYAKTLQRAIYAAGDPDEIDAELDWFICIHNLIDLEHKNGRKSTIDRFYQERVGNTKSSLESGRVLAIGSGFYRPCSR